MIRMESTESLYTILQTLYSQQKKIPQHFTQLTYVRSQNQFNTAFKNDKFNDNNLFCSGIVYDTQQQQQQQ